MANRPVFDNNQGRKAGQTQSKVAMIMAMLGLGGSDMMDAVTNIRTRGSKYKPHQGSSECARRVKQGKAGMNMNLVAKPSQDFSKSHWNNPVLKRKVAALEASNG